MQRTVLFWSKDAYRHGKAPDGRFTPDGYIDQALAVYRNPEQFAQQDVEKAIRVLRSQRMPDCSDRLALWLKIEREKRTAGTA